MNLICALSLSLCFGGAARADCLVIDQLDKLHILQTRLAADPATGLFPTDIRQIRAISAGLTDSATLQAVDGNAIMGKGADFAQFLRNTQSMLQGVSMDDPLSALGHYTAARRQNLSQIGDYLTDLRCTDEQIAIAQAQQADDPIRGNTDAEDLRDVTDALVQLADEIFRIRTFVILAAIGAFAAIVTPILRRWLILRRRRLERRATHYATSYRIGDKTHAGVVIDVNCFGCKLRHCQSIAPATGTTLIVELEDASCAGQVKWGNAHYSGVQFHAAIDLALVLRICNAAGAPSLKT